MFLNVIMMDDAKFNIMMEDLYALFPMVRKKLFMHRRNHRGDKLPPSHYQVLGILKKQGELPMSEIGKLAHIHKSNMTSLTDKLVEEGVAVRMPDATDRRRIKLAISDRGIEKLDHWKKQQYNDIKTRISSLSEDDQEKLYRSVKDIKDILSKIQ